MNGITQPDLDDAVDIVIMGGGLAGLTLALQLRQRFANRSIRVLERQVHPVAVAAHKVGESTVEIAAHYFSQVLGLRDHLRECQLRKFGLRFFFSEGRRDIAQVGEVGASRHLSTPSYQLDRGSFENHLVEVARERGIDTIDGARVTGFQLGEGDAPHRVSWDAGHGVRQTSARWLLDASGRAGLIKRRLGLAEENAHHAHAVWFRVRGFIRIDDWSDDSAWRARCTPAARWLSTNHLLGAGYWVWLIPLASGHHSVGIVADPRFHRLDSMDTFDKAMDWLREFQPLLHDELDRRRDDLLDFKFFRRFSYGCRQVFSANRWALTGEAGAFLDPFYSPGSDFIAISNTMITELVARDLAGERIGAHAHVYDQLYRSFYESTLALYQDQYGIMGDPRVLPRKIVWDYTYYWAILSQFFFQERLTDLSMLSRLRDELAHCRELNLAVQGLLRQWSQAGAHQNQPVMHDHAAMPWFCELNRSLGDVLPAEEFFERIRASCRQLTRLAGELMDSALIEHPDLDTTALRHTITLLQARDPAPHSGAQKADCHEPMLIA